MTSFDRFLEIYVERRDSSSKAIQIPTEKTSCHSRTNLRILAFFLDLFLQAFGFWEYGTNGERGCINFATDSWNRCGFLFLRPAVQEYVNREALIGENQRVNLPSGRARGRFFAFILSFVIWVVANCNGGGAHGSPRKLPVQ